MDSQGVITGGPVLLTPEGQGGFALLHNLGPMLTACGFYCGLSGWTPYALLEEQTIQVNGGVLSLLGRLPGIDTWLSQRVSIQKNSVRFDLSLAGGQPFDDLQWANFSFYLPTILFSGQRYRAGDFQYTYPPVLPSDHVLAKGVDHIEICSDEPGLNYCLDAPTGMTLLDGRKWGGSVYELSVKIPLETGQATFTLGPPTLDPGPNQPALRWSHIGYFPEGEKLAVLEIDGRDQWGDLEASIERETPAGGSDTVFISEFVPFEDEYRKRFALLDFSDLEEPGRYRIVWSGGSSEWFPIDAGIYRGLWRPTLEKFLPFQMCHLAVDLGDGLRAHAACHLDDGIQAKPAATGPDGFISYESDAGPGPGEPLSAATGGWHDAGDNDLNVSAQAFVTHLLALGWEQFAPAGDNNSLDVIARRMQIGSPDGRSDLLEQVEWGARWLLSMQQDDGRVYVGVVEQAQASGALALPEETTDGLPGTGDEREVYVDLHSDVLLKFAASMACAGRALSAYSGGLAVACLQAAQKAWTYFMIHAETYRPTVYFPSGRQGREQMILAAATELYITFSDPAYLEAMSVFEPYLLAFPTEWPSPTVTTHMSYWYAAPFLARLLPRLQQGSLRDAVSAALQRAAAALRPRLVKRPFPMEPWDCGDWGNNGLFLGRIFDAYWLEQAVPGQISLLDALPCANWLFGLHPVNDLTFVFGAAQPEPRFLYSATLLKRFGEFPAGISGAVVPGISRYGRANVLAYRDWPQEFYNGEACIYDAALFIFDMLALESLDQRRRLYLPSVFG